MAAAILFTFGSTALLLTVNALRRLRRPRASFPPLWLPGMVTTELAPLWIVVSLVVGGTLAALGALDLAIGRLGGWLVLASVAGLVVIVIRSHTAIRRIEHRVETEPFDERWPTALLGRPAPLPEGLEQLDDVPYAPGLTMDLIRRRDRGSTPAPAFLYVHGGGWTGGDPYKQAHRMYHTLAREGWLVAIPRYPLAPVASVPEQVQAVKQAIHHLKTNADELGTDAGRIVLSGSSAGGHLASLAALTGPPLFQEGFEQADTSVVACIPMYGIYDMANRRDTRRPWPYVDRDVMKARYEDDPDAFHLVSPVDHVDAAGPPFLVIHGTHDSLVPIAEAEAFVSDLESAGAEVELVEVLGAQHGFDAVSSPVSRYVAALVTTWANRAVEHRSGTVERP